jgi:Tol biopolymer transport system component
MTRERWEQIERLFQAATQRPVTEHEAFLKENCGGDDSLRLEVESLLAGPPSGTPGAQSDPAAGKMAGPYRLLSPLGAGGMGEVWRALDPRVNRDVAIKFCGAQFSERFGREARAIAALNHPNICHLYDVGPNYLVMELVEGESPAGPLPLDRALQYARQVADALETAHERGIIHRDLKPGNIKVRTDGTVKVLDFGLAKMAGGTQNLAPHSATISMDQTQGVILGTPAYMSPEQVRGLEVDKRSDIWAFGVLLYEMLTGERPFEKPNVPDTMASVLTVEPDWERVPVRARRLVRRCLEKDPRKRLRDLGDAWELLDDGATAAPRTDRLRWAGWIAAAAVALIAAGATWSGLRSRISESKPLVRLDVDLGPDVSLDLTGVQNVLLSPDGTRLVYVSRDRLFTRRLDQSEAKEIPDTQGATSPFLSPDGSWVGFYGHGGLRKVSLDGGVAITLCSTSAYFTGASWGDDGNIVASLSPAGPLVRVPSGGGNPQPVTEMDRTRREVSHRLPQVLPGSRAVIFTAHTSTTGYDDANIEVMTLADHHRKTLIRGGTFGRYLPSGHLIYVSRGTLYAVPFDKDRLEVQGKATPVLDHILYSPMFGSAQIAFSQNGTVIYRAGESEYGMVTVQWLDSTGARKPLLARPGRYLNPRLSPDGRRLVLSAGEGSVRGLWIYNRQQDTMTALTHSEGVLRLPIWSPDGRFIVYREQGGISAMRADGGGEPWRLIKNENDQVPTSFTADGKRLAFYQSQGAGGVAGSDVWTVPVENDGSTLRAGTPEPFLQTRFDEYNPSFSPNGRWLAYTSDESGPYQVYVRAFPDNGRRWQVSSSGGLCPIFSKSGSELFFLNQDNQIMLAKYTTKGDEFVPERPAVWSEGRIAMMGVPFWNYDVAPDGKRVIALMAPDSPQQQRAQNHVIFLENFFDELRRIVPPGK